MLLSNTARIRQFRVFPRLPEKLNPLMDLAYNLWWTWHPEAVNLFARIDRDLWTRTNHNPVQLLGLVAQERLEAVAKDEGFIASMRDVLGTLNKHTSRTPWHEEKTEDDFLVAYFCAEFGLTECFNIYSGGLGCLAGDHLKSASSLGLPLIGVGLLYRHGYFQQYLNSEGWQQEYYPELDFANLPVRPVEDKNGDPLKVSVTLPGREVHVQVWQVFVGRITLYLLDSNLQENNVADRQITGQLYGGDSDMRIRQEIVLGIGGMRALKAMGIAPDVYHMNEGHSAFLALERIGNFIEDLGVSFDEARIAASSGHVFTTHTPVPAGIDRFPTSMIKHYFKEYHARLSLDMEGLLALGRENVFDPDESFSMAVLAIRTSDWANGVSKLHGHVSRKMWQNIWPGIPENEVPIGHVTNGVHARSWLSEDLTYLLDRYLGERWQNRPADQSVWDNVNNIPDEELWRVRERRRHKLILWARGRLYEQLLVRGHSPEKARTLSDALDTNALTIGFARRFATYKRGNLMLEDPERLKALLNHPERPVQILIAGKSHPADQGGKGLIRNLLQFARENDLLHKIVFLENYDIGVARHLIQGCDVWLNTPIRGMEASGTSGMKSAINGGLNCSILDGWWDEAYEVDLGWAIGKGENYADEKIRDEVESQAIYDLLERSIVPLFYERDNQGMPRQWMKYVKQTIARLAPAFNTNRMLKDYTTKFYLPAARRSQTLLKDQLSPAKDVARKINELREQWNQIHIESVEAESESLGVNEPLKIEATVGLSSLAPEDVSVEIYYGHVDGDGNVFDGLRTPMSHQKQLKDGRHQYTCNISESSSGQFGYAIRVMPGSQLSGYTLPGLIHWETQ